MDGEIQADVGRGAVKEHKEQASCSLRETGKHFLELGQGPGRHTGQEIDTVLVQVLASLLLRLSVIQ